MRRAPQTPFSASKIACTSIVEGGSHDVVLKNATPSIMNG